MNIIEGKKVLVGDYTSASIFTKMILEDLGLNVTIVTTMDEIYNKIKNGEKFDIIFTNKTYKEGMSILLLLKLKELPNFNIPIVIHTVEDNINNIFLTSGFDGYLKNPIKKEETLSLLEKLL